MAKDGLGHGARTERAIIDALLKISEIVQKTEAIRERQKPTNATKRPRKLVGDGDTDQQRVPVPPPMRTLDSQLSTMNHRPVQQPSNCNRATNPRSKQGAAKDSHRSSEQNQQYTVPAAKYLRRHETNIDPEHLNKRHRHHICPSESTASSSDNEASEDHHWQHGSVQSKTRKTQSVTCPESHKAEHPTMMSTGHSQATTILDEHSSCSTMMPVVSAPTISPPLIIGPPPVTNTTEPFHAVSPSPLAIDSISEFKIFIDQQLQKTLMTRLQEKSIPSTDTVDEHSPCHHRQARLPTLTKSETGKLIDQCHFGEHRPNSDYYDKQREAAMVAAEQSNYALSYTIYTNLLHDSQYDCQSKSEILASRATTLLLEEKCFESIDDCTQAIAYNQWNKLAYVVRAACWMIKQEYGKAVEDYSKLFHFFDQSQHVLDLLNLAYGKLKASNEEIEDERSIQIEQTNQLLHGDRRETSIPPLVPPSVSHSMPPLSFTSPTASFHQPTVYLCYPYQAYPACYNGSDEPLAQAGFMVANSSFTSHPSFSADQPRANNNNALSSSIGSSLRSAVQDQASPITDKRSSSHLMWIKNASRSH